MQNSSILLIRYAGVERDSTFLASTAIMLRNNTEGTRSIPRSTAVKPL